MADVTISVQNIVVGGLVVVHTSGLNIPDTHKVRNDGQTFIRVVNGGGSPAVVTIATPTKVGGNAIADRVVSVAAGTEQNIGPFPPGIYNDSNGDINITFDFVTTVTIAALHLG